jgi:hypothetical protein
MGENQRGKVYALTELFLIGSLYVDQASLQLMIFLPQSPKYWYYRCAPSHYAPSWDFYSYVLKIQGKYGTKLEILQNIRKC